MRARHFALAGAFALGFSSRPARAQECENQRPTDPGGYAGIAYGADAFASYGEGGVLVWYALSGPHAPDLASTRPDNVPDNVAQAAAVGADALARYQALGFRPPKSDGDALACSSNGGDGQFDVYLVHFAAGADGSAIPENCVEIGPKVICSTFTLIESRLELRSYGTFDLGIRTVLPHELFHGVQNAYDVDTDRYWSEGGAQWAADLLDPTLHDLEYFLPAFFRDPTHPIDLSAGGVVASYLYGSAVWPLFLAQRYGHSIIADALEQESLAAISSAKSVDVALLARGSSLAAEFPLFASWNVATGARAGVGGYPSAATYPEVPTVLLEPGVSKQGLMTGLSTTYFTFQAGQHSYHLALEADPARLAGRFVPLEGGKANLDKASELPADVSGEGVVVVAGKSTLKTDANFTLSSVLLPDPTMPTPTTPVPTTPPPTGSMPVPTTPVPTVMPPGGTPPGATPTMTVADTDDGGCSLSSPPRGGGRTGALAPLVGLGLALGAARRRALGRVAGAALAALALLGCDSSDSSPITKPGAAGSGGGGGQAGAPAGGAGGGGGGGGQAGAAPSCDSAREELLGPIDDISDGTVSIVTEDGDEKSLFVDASGGGSAMSAASSARVYLSLSKAARVDVTDPDATASGDWDVALKRSVIYANGGDGGTGGRTIALVTKGFDDVAPGDADGVTFRTESFFDAECTPKLDAIDEVQTTFSDWYDYNGNDNTLTPKAQTYLVRRADGATFKLAVESYYTSPEGEPLTPVAGPDSATYLLRFAPL